MAARTVKFSKGVIVSLSLLAVKRGGQTVFQVRFCVIFPILDCLYDSIVLILQKLTAGSGKTRKGAFQNGDGKGCPSRLAKNQRCGRKKDLLRRTIDDPGRLR